MRSSLSSSRASLKEMVCLGRILWISLVRALGQVRVYIGREMNHKEECLTGVKKVVILVFCQQVNYRT